MWDLRAVVGHLALGVNANVTYSAILTSDRGGGEPVFANVDVGLPG